MKKWESTQHSFPFKWSLFTLNATKSVDPKNILGINRLCCPNQILTNGEWDKVFILENFSRPVEEPFWLEFVCVFPVASLFSCHFFYCWLCDKIISDPLYVIVIAIVNGDLEDFCKKRKDQCIFWKNHSTHRKVPECWIRHKGKNRLGSSLWLCGVGLL